MEFVLNFFEIKNKTIMFKLSEKTIIKAGGRKVISSPNVSYVDLWLSDINRRNWLKFYNYGDGWNVYLISRECDKCIQLTTVSNIISFRLLILVLK